MQYLSAFARTAASLLTVFILSAPSWAENLLLNPGAEQGKGDYPSVWSRAMIAADGLRMARSTDEHKGGKAALMIVNDHDYDKEVANNWMQSLQNVPRGAALRVSASIRTQDADSANVCLQCWDVTGEKMLAFASTPVIRGDQDWIHVASDPMIVPDGTKSIFVRAALGGKGKVWFDDLEVSSEDGAISAGGQGDPVENADKPNTTASIESELPKDLPGRIVKRLPINKDCMVLAYIPDWQHGNVDNIAVANNDGGVRALFAWKPLEKSVIEAANRRIYLAVYSRKTTSVGDPSEITVSPISINWPELTSWKSQPKLDETTKPVSAKLTPGEGWKLFDITPLMQKSATANQHGVMLKFKEEKQSGEKQNWSGYDIVTRETLGEWKNRHPQLLVVEGVADAGPEASSKK
jgi:hypothetical protein